MVRQRILAAQTRRQMLQRRLQTVGQNCQAHYFDQTNVFFFDVVQLRVRMKNPQRMLVARAVIAQHQIQFKHTLAHTRNRCDGVVWRVMGLRKNPHRRVAVPAPIVQ